MEKEVTIKDRLKTMLWCFIAMSIFGTIIILFDSKLNEHIYLLITPFIVAIVSFIGVVIIYFKTKPCKD